MSIGYTDYIRESKQGGNLLDSGTIIMSGGSAGHITYVGNYEYVILTIDTTATTHLVGMNFFFYTDESQTVSMGQTVAAVNNGIRDSVVVRVRGPWMIPIFFWWDSANTDTIKYYLFGTNLTPIPNIGTVGIGQWAYYQASIAASGNTTIQPVSWHNGKAKATLMTSVAANGILTVQQYQYAIGWQTYLNVQQSSGANRGDQFEFPIPPTPVRFTLVNGANAATFYFMAAPTDLIAA